MRLLLSRCQRSMNHCMFPAKLLAPFHEILSMTETTVGALVQLLHQKGKILVVAVDEIVKLGQFLLLQIRDVKLSDDASDRLGRELA